MAAAALLLCSCGKDSSKDTPNNYGFKYPTSGAAENAVWWMMHENRICKEPSVSEDTGDGGYYFYGAGAMLDLNGCGFLGINDYFGQIEAAGYSIVPALSDDLSEWLNPTKKYLNTYFKKVANPYESFDSYADVWDIELQGTPKNSAYGEKPTMYIGYRYQHIDP